MSLLQTSTFGINYLIGINRKLWLQLEFPIACVLYTCSLLIETSSSAQKAFSQPTDPLEDGLWLWWFASPISEEYLGYEGAVFSPQETKEAQTVGFWWPENKTQKIHCDLFQEFALKVCRRGGCGSG